jgi:hypothetical protein
MALVSSNKRRKAPRTLLSGKGILYVLYSLGALMLIFNVYFFWQHRAKKLKPSARSSSSSNGNGNDNGNNHNFNSKSNSMPSVMTPDQDRAYVLAIFRDAGIVLDDESMAALPSWSSIKEYIGDAPTIFGLDSCSRFQSIMPAVERNLGCSGMFNTGTNLVTQLLKENCKIPERVALYGINATREAHGIRWQVPWGKHTHAKYREEHSTEKAKLIKKESVLPVVTIRNPYHWMTTMCKHPYSAKWDGFHDKLCPNLIDHHHQLVELNVKYADSRSDHHLSLAHLWNDWYRYYYDTDLYPRIMVRFEDLIFHAKNLTHQICSCAGGEIRADRPFQYIVDSAKDGPGHGSVRTGMVSAWIKYGKPLKAMAGYSKADWEAAREFLDKDLMETFNYQHPPEK